MRRAFALDFLGVGPQRTGTTWLHAHFRDHPEVMLPKEPTKEVHFFDEEYDRGWEWYAGQFPTPEDLPERGVWGEFGPAYFDIPAIPQRIHERAPDCKIIVSLRPPVDRTRALFHHHLKYGGLPEDFSEAIRLRPRILSSSHYRSHLERWLEFFGEDQVHVLFLRDIKESPVETLDAICDFLGVTRFDPDSIQREAVNAAFFPQWPWLEELKIRVGRYLQTHGLQQLLDWLRRVYRRTLKDRVERSRDLNELPELSENQIRGLEALFGPDVEWIGEFTGRDFQLSEL